jgi:hypothetical protein
MLQSLTNKKRAALPGGAYHGQDFSRLAGCYGHSVHLKGAILLSKQWGQAQPTFNPQRRSRRELLLRQDQHDLQDCGGTRTVACICGLQSSQNTDCVFFEPCCLRGQSALLSLLSKTANSMPDFVLPQFAAGTDDKKCRLCPLLNSL